MTSTKYVNGGDNSLLKLALVGAWGERCYLDRERKAFSDLQIDHILARDTPPDELKSLLFLHGVPLADFFSVDDPQNLAPVCSRHNIEKSNRNTRAGTMTIYLSKARERAGKVADTIRAFDRNSQLAKSLIAVARSDTRNPADRGVLQELGDLLLDKLCRVKLPPVDEQRDVALELGQVTFEYTNDTRLLQLAMAQLLEIELDDALEELASQLADFIYDGVLSNALNRQIKMYDNVGPMSVEYTQIFIQELGWSKDGKRLSCNVAGNFKSAASASVVRDNIDGGIADFDASMFVDVDFVGSTLFHSPNPEDHELWEFAIQTENDVTAMIS